MLSQMDYLRWDRKSANDFQLEHSPWCQKLPPRSANYDPIESHLDSQNRCSAQSLQELYLDNNKQIVFLKHQPKVRGNQKQDTQAFTNRWYLHKMVTQQSNIIIGVLLPSLFNKSRGASKEKLLRRLNEPRKNCVVQFDNTTKASEG
jgi:hypothetical protein